MSSVKLFNINKSFNEKLVLDNINLDIRDGELISLLGVSGCGKSTTLQLIAGLIEPDNGDILFNNESVINIPTDKREAVIVFQEYLLFPHMNVYDNIDFGLKVRKVDKKVRKEKVNSLINIVKLNGYENRYPSQLSGGQKQRVAIARALAVNPKVLLLDEPFSSLDINLREEMREFILNLQKELKITTVLVTHDKEEALVMSDRIAVMVNGKIEQFDNPVNLYTKPKTKEVANIFGDRNYIKGKVEKNLFKSDTLNIPINGYKDSNNIEIMIPKEAITIYKKEHNYGERGIIKTKRYAGDKVYYHIDINGYLLKSISTHNEFTEYEEVKIDIDRSKIIIFDM